MTFQEDFPPLKATLCTGILIVIPSLANQMWQ